MLHYLNMVTVLEMKVSLSTLHLVPFNMAWIIAGVMSLPGHFWPGQVAMLFMEPCKLKVPRLCQSQQLLQWSSDKRGWEPNVMGMDWYVEFAVIAGENNILCLDPFSENICG